MLERRRLEGGSGAGRAYDREEDSMASSFPALVDFLSQVTWPDGERRQLGTVLLFLDDGVAKCWVNDKDAERTAWVSCDTFWGLLERVDKGIREDTLEWREARSKGQRKK